MTGIDDQSYNDLEGEIYDDYDFDMWSEGEDSYADGEWLASAGFGTDEDYGYYGEDF